MAVIPVLFLPHPKGPDRQSLPWDIYTKTTTDKSFCYTNSHVLPVQVSTIHSMTPAGID